MVGLRGPFSERNGGSVSNLYNLKIKDGRFIQCYYWETRRADFGTDQAMAWRGTLDEAEKLGRQWDSSTRPMPVQFTMERYIVRLSFFESMLVLHTFASSADDAVTRFHNTFVDATKRFDVREPDVSNVDSGKPWMREFWKYHGHAFDSTNQPRAATY
jgi:hypothetical protein